MSTNNELKYEDLKKKIDSIDSDEIFDFVSKEPDAERLETCKIALSSLFDERECKKAVLGVDVFKYSQLDYKKQQVIPFILTYLRRQAQDAFFEYEKFFSFKYEQNQIEDEFIDTGDGGFFFFYTPLDALVFSLYFNIFLHLFNSFHLYPVLRKYVGALTFRFSITFENVYKINSKFYGPAIINNARIISKDKLNRFLIDDKTYEWFLLNTRGVENLSHIKRNDLKHLVSEEVFKQDDLGTGAFGMWENGQIEHVFCQKLEKILVKDDRFDVYNLVVQSFLTLCGERHPKENMSVVTTLGNMNCNGI